MPISPSRTCARQMAHSRSLQNGMTMIEILVVLSIIATAAFVVTLSLPSQSAERSLHQEADLLSARLNLAAERSLIERRVFRFGWSSEGYGFEEWVQGDWRAVQDMPLSEGHRFDRGLVLTDGDGAGGGQVARDLGDQAAGGGWAVRDTRAQPLHLERAERSGKCRLLLVFLCHGDAVEGPMHGHAGVDGTAS